MPPKMYKKLICTEISRDFRAVAKVVSTDYQAPKANEITVKNMFAGINASDINIAAGLYFVDAEAPFDLGAETTGEVVAVGQDVTQYKQGDHVATLVIGGGFREYLTLPAELAIPIPKATPEITSMILNGLTAKVGLDVVGEMKSGETIFVTAAAGGVGHFVVQLAKKAGNHVVCTCGSDEKVDFLKRLGADRVINYNKENVAAVLKAEYQDKLNLVFEMVGGDFFDAAVDNLAEFGRLVICGCISEYQSGPVEVQQARIYHKLLWKCASLRAYIFNRYPEHLPQKLTELIEAYQSGELEVVVDSKRFEGVESVVDAVDHMYAGKNIGKIIVHI